MNFYGRDFLTLLDYTPEEINYLIDLAAELKAKKKQGRGCCRAASSRTSYMHSALLFTYADYDAGSVSQ